MDIRAAAQYLAGRLGYRIERLRTPLPGAQMIVIDLVLEALNAKRGGALSFVEIGANDGQVEDPLYPWLTRFPWRGVLVEPQPQLCDRLRALWSHREGVHVVHAAIGRENGEATLWCIEDRPGDGNRSGLASLDRESLLRRAMAIPEIQSRLKPVRVPVMTLDSLLGEIGMSGMDILQIDAEGFDFEIIKMIDFSRIKPDVIGYEHCNLGWDDQCACRRLLAEQGYVFAAYHGDTIAVQSAVLPASLDRSMCRL